MGVTLLDAFLNSRTQRERLLLQERWLKPLESSYDSPTPRRDLARQFGVGTERIMQIEQKCLKRLLSFLQRTRVTVRPHEPLKGKIRVCLRLEDLEIQSSE